MNNYNKPLLADVRVEGFSANMDFIVYNRSREVKAVSLIGYDNQIKNINQIISNETEYSMRLSSEEMPRDLYVPMTGEKESKITKLENGISHSFMKLKGVKDGRNIRDFVITENEEDLATLVFNKLYAFSDVPMLKKWKHEIYQFMLDRGFFNRLTIYTFGKDKIGKEYFGLEFSITDYDIENAISDGLKHKRIVIDENSDISDEFKNISGLDDYLSLFSSNIAEQIESSFKPKFVPGVDKYDALLNEFDQTCYENGINLFNEQKDVIQASSNNLNKNDVTFVIGEMGTGKVGLR